jgi:hypothetical protein
MASADEIERERRRLAFLQYAASQGFSGTTPISDIPIMTESAGPISTESPVKPGLHGGVFGDNIKGLGSMLGNSVLSFIPGTQQSYDLSNVLQTSPQDIPLGMLKSFVSTGSNLVDVLPYVDTKEPGINYINDYREGKLFSTALEDILNAIAVGSVAKAGMTAGTSAVRNNITNPGARFNPYEYGIHVSKTDRGDIPYINPRQIGQIQATAADAMPGNSYMWDATNPNTVGGIFSNPQMARVDIDPVTGKPISQFMGEEFQYPVGYFVRAPKSRTGTDINIPDSEALAVQGRQKVFEKIVLDNPQALQDLLSRRRVMEMTQDAASRKILANRNMPGVPEAIANRNSSMAENFIRDNIANRVPGYENYNVNMSLYEIINHPILGRTFKNIVAGRELAAKLTQGIE